MASGLGQPLIRGDLPLRDLFEKFIDETPVKSHFLQGFLEEAETLAI